MPKKTKTDELQHKIDELTLDLQRTRADFENYRKRTELEKTLARDAATANAILRLLPVIDNIERAVNHLPDDLKNNTWAQSVVGLSKNLDKSLESLNLKRIEASAGTEFDPHLHEAIHMEDGEGDKEVISEVLQAGYTLQDNVIRHAMVKVSKQ